MKQSILLLVMLALLCAACGPANQPIGPLSELPSDAYKALDQRVRADFDVDDYTVVTTQKSGSGKSWCIVFDPPLKGSIAGQSLWYDYAVVQPDGKSWQAVMVEDHQGGIVLDFLGCKAVYKGSRAVATPSQAADTPMPAGISMPEATTSPGRLVTFSIPDTRDEALPGYVDVLHLDVTVFEDDSLEATFTLRELPASITVGREGVREDRLEYGWCAHIFLDRTRQQDEPDYGLCHQYWEMQSDLPQEVSLDSSGQTAVWQYSPDGSFSLVDDGSIEVDYQAKTITLRGKIAGVTDKAWIKFITVDYLKGQDE